MINNNNNKKVIPVVLYNNAEICKFLIYDHNKNRSGIYKWTNLNTGEFYIGSAINLTNRLRNYFSKKSLLKQISRSRSRINNSLLKYGYSNFSLEILEYCELNVLLQREQYYMDLLNPEYNILKIAGSRLGTKHSPETLLKLKIRKLSPEAFFNLKKTKKDFNPLFPLKKSNQLLKHGHIITVLNTIDNLSKVYISKSAAARNLNVCPGAISYAIINKSLLKKNS